MRLRAWITLTIAASLTLLVTLLAVSPPYAGLAAGLQLDPALLFAPLRTYLFRNAVIDSGWLLLGVSLFTLPLGWVWAYTGIPRAVRPLLLLPIFLADPLVGLLWRPLLAPWLELALAPLSLIITALVILWRSVPLAAWCFMQKRDAWRTVLALCALLILLDASLILTLTHGEPYNASHTWMSWIVQQLWTNRAWGYAASMAGGLALVVALVTWWLPTSSGDDLPATSPLGLIVALAWVLSPFIMPLLAFLQAPGVAIRTLVSLRGLLWLLNGALVWGGATLLAVYFVWRVQSSRLRRLVWVLTIAMLPINTVALGYLAYQAPFLGSRWLLIALTCLFAAGLIMGAESRSQHGVQQWLNTAGCALLVMAHTFPLQLVLYLPSNAWTPALGIVWTLGDAPQATAALGAALLLCGLWAGVGAWMVTYRQDYHVK